METLQESRLLKFNKNTLSEVRDQLNLSKNDVNKIIDNFEEWISKQNHFTKKKFNRHYLETSLINAKGSLERAKKTLDKLCTLKSLLPEFFNKHDVKNDLIDSTKFMLQATTPKLLKNNYRLYFIKIASTDFDANMLSDYHRFSILMSEYAKANDYSLGFTCVVDCRGINFLNLKLNIMELRNSITIMTEGYGFRISAIHLLSTSKAVDGFITLLKQVVSSKIGNRIHSHKTVESLYEHVERECLPKDYGGDQPTLNEISQNWIDVLSQKENVAFFKDICEAKTDEKHRLASNYNDQILGMPGSFRSLSVD